MSFSIRKIGMLEMPKIAMLSTGFLLLYKVLIGFRYQWPRNEKEVQVLTAPQYHRLLEGLAIEQKRFSLPKDLV